MDLSPRLGLPYIAPQQAQKQVTYNEAMRALDVLVQTAAKSRTLAAPPGSPLDGDTYIVAPAATGGWAGQDGRVATFVDGGWSFRVPVDGWLAYIIDATEIAVCQSGAWTPLVSHGGSSLAKLGINATADLTNRLAVGAAASLFTHDGTDHRLKINKNAAGDTASLMFQTGFTGHAEFGLTGDNDVRLKVSDNGSTWFDALTVARASGTVGLPAGQLAFPAIQNPSANPNVLDDYEEGTWTPADGSGAGLSFTFNSTNTYRKVGDLVTFFFDILYPATANGANAVVTGLPFVCSANTFGLAMPGWTSSASLVVGLVNKASANMLLYGLSSTPRTNASLSGLRIVGTGTYHL